MPMVTSLITFIATSCHKNTSSYKLVCTKNNIKQQLWFTNDIIVFKIVNKNTICLSM